MGKNVIFGVRPIMEAIDAGKEIDRVLLKKGIDSEVIDRLKEMCDEHRIATQYVPVEKLNRMVAGAHQGVVAQISAIEYAEITDVLEDIKAVEGVPLIVVFDGVTDVRNFGAIARSAECAGAQALIVPMKNAAPVNADAIKTSAGALHIIPVCRVGSLRNTLKMLQMEGMQVVVATEKSTTTLYEADFKKPTVIVMGSEDRGVSNEIIKMCDVRLSIPMVGTIESLNVSAAAAVMLFEAVRQRG